MVSVKHPIFVFLFVIQISSILAAVPCNFNKDCGCSTDGPVKPNQTDYHSATCTFRGKLGPLVTNPGLKYSLVNLFLDLNGAETFEIPANYFKDFSEITTLNFSPDRYIKHNWDPKAFDGISPAALRTYGVDGLLPPPPALQELGKRGLQELSISGSGSIRFGDNYFKDFTNLLELDIFYFDMTVHVDEITDNAFAGLEKSLARLYLPQCTMKDFPAVALSKLQNLTRLYMSAGNFKNFPKNSLKPLTKLVELDLSNSGQYGGILSGTTDLKQAFEDGVFDSLPSTLQRLDVSYTNLPAIIPKTLLQGTVRYEGNLITSVRKGDFGGTESTAYLDLDYNPITKIEPNSLPPLKSHSYSFRYTNLDPLLDLSVFSFADSANVELYFDENPTVTNLTVSDISKIPTNVKVQIWVLWALEYVDPKIGDMLKQVPGIHLSITSNANIICENASWMSYHVFCTKQLSVANSFCKDKDGIPLKKYLFINYAYPACYPTRNDV